MWVGRGPGTWRCLLLLSVEFRSTARDVGALRDDLEGHCVEKIGACTRVSAGVDNQFDVEDVGIAGSCFGEGVGGAEAATTIWADGISVGGQAREWNGEQAKDCESF